MDSLVLILAAVAIGLGGLVWAQRRGGLKLQKDLQASADARRAAEGALHLAQLQLAEATATQTSLREAQAAADLRHAELQRDLTEKTAKLAQFEAELRAERQHSAEKLQQLRDMRDQMQVQFQSMAQEALKQQGESFSKTNLERLEAVLSPLREHVGHFEKELKSVHENTLKDRAALRAEIAQLTKRSEEISHEATALTRALKGDRQKQGAWGEMVLESILERSGLREGDEYQVQAHRSGDDGQRLRPDVVVHLPGKKSLVIDSKVSLGAYVDALDAEDDGVAMAARKRHAAALRAHVMGLSKKSYHLAEDVSVDYVIMFVPIEGALSEALREDPKLTEEALKHHITIATPTTLMMALRTVAHVWAVERRNENAEKIAQRAEHLYNKVASFVENMHNLGQRLNQARDSYDTALGQLAQGRGNVLSQVDKLRTLGAVRGKPMKIDFDDDELDDDLLPPNDTPALPQGE
jgi:DNA recombination protein RmuC